MVSNLSNKKYLIILISLFLLLLFLLYYNYNESSIATFINTTPRKKQIFRHIKINKLEDFGPVDTSDMILNGVNPNIKMHINYNNSFGFDSIYEINYRIPLWKYIKHIKENNRLGTPLVKFIKTEPNKTYLFLLHFTGGAHCCFVYSVFKFNEKTEAFKYLGDEWFDAADLVDFENYEKLEYPIHVNHRAHYYYSSYLVSPELECAKSDYKELLVVRNDSVKIVYQGNPTELEKCIIKYIKKTKIPKLIGPGDDSHPFAVNDDNGERELIMNALDDLYNLTNDIDQIFEIFINYMPNLEDKISLWEETFKLLLPKNELIKHQNIKKLEDQKLKLKNKL